MDPSWWILLFYRGFANDMASVKKGILEYVFGLQNPLSLNLLASHGDFIFGTLLKSIDIISMYSVPTQGTLVSPFGEKLKEFMHRLVQAIDTQEHKVKSSVFFLVMVFGKKKMMSKNEKLIHA